MEKSLGKKQKHHQRVWSFARTIICPWLKGIYHIQAENASPRLKDIEGSYLVLSNHNGNLDPGFLGLSFRKQMYFVASENVYRSGFSSKLLKWAFEPIAKIKGASDAMTVMKMVRTLRNGMNVALFPEGNRSYDGRTGEINVATGKLIKVSGANLVTYRLEGGYFTTPRWAATVRKGKLYGHVVNVYSKEQLKELKPEEIVALVKADLYEDAYERQAAAPIAYKGKRLAEGLECSLAVCPGCRSIGSLVTKNASISCKTCSLSTTINEYGYFEDGFMFHTVTEWDDFQTEFFREFTQDALAAPEAEAITPEQEADAEGAEIPEIRQQELFSDDGVEVVIFKEDHSEQLLGTGQFCMYTDKITLVLEDGTVAMNLPLEAVSDMSIFGRANIVFTADGNIHYEAKARTLINARKYLAVFRNLKAAGNK